MKICDDLKLQDYPEKSQAIKFIGQKTVEKGYGINIFARQPLGLWGLCTWTPLPSPPQDPVYYFCLPYLRRVIFYFIKVTKTVDGGAAGCKKCPIGMEDEG